MEIKTIRIKEETWRRLMGLKIHSSQTFNVIINRLIDNKQFNVKGGIIKNDTQNQNALEKIDKKSIH